MHVDAGKASIATDQCYLLMETELSMKTIQAAMVR